MVEDLISSLRRIAKVSYGATIEEARMVSKTQRDAAELIEQQAARITALESERATLLHDVEIHARWQPIETAPEGRLVVVAWLDKDDPKNPERYMFDFIEDDGWVKHNEDYDHFCCVAPPGSTGPSADAPYTHWLLIPELPEAPANQKQAG